VTLILPTHQAVGIWALLKEGEPHPLSRILAHLINRYIIHLVFDTLFAWSGGLSSPEARLWSNTHFWRKSSQRLARVINTKS
jgi:hypothetical protein